MTPKTQEQIEAFLQSEFLTEATSAVRIIQQLLEENKSLKAEISGLQDLLGK